MLPIVRMFELPNAKRYSPRQTGLLHAILCHSDWDFPCTPVKWLITGRVRRSDLLLFSAPPPPGNFPPASPDRQQVRLDLEYVDVRNGTATGPQTQARDAQPSTCTSTARPTNGSDEKDEEEAFEFRLFSAPSRVKSAAAAAASSAATPPQPHSIQRIKIRSPTPLLHPSSSAISGAFVVPHRPQSYYFADPDRTKGEKKNFYAQVAVSGAQVRESARRTRWVSWLPTCSFLPVT